MTCLVVTYTQKLLVAGYDSGHIILWDIPRKQFLKVIVPVTADEGDQKGVDGHMVGHRIVHLAFVGPKERFVSADEKVACCIVKTFMKSLCMHTGTRILPRL